MTTDRSRLQQLRRIAKRHDMAIKKSRVRYTHADDFGEYRLIDITKNAVVRGAKFDLSLDDIAEYFDVGLASTEKLNEKDADEAYSLPPVSFVDTAKNLRLMGKHKEADKFEKSLRKLIELTEKRGSKS